MTLHDAIAKILKDSDNPLSTDKLAEIINSTELYKRKDFELVDKGQIRARVKKYPNLFDYVNGQVVLTSDVKWKNILTSYRYLTDILRNYFSQSDLQFLIISLFCIKRLNDIEFSNHQYIISIDDFNDSRFNIIDDYNQLNILSDVSQLLSQLEYSKLEEVFMIINQLQIIDYNDQEFGSIFEYFIYNSSKASSNPTTQYTPVSLQELMVSLLDPQSGKTLYDPVCGSGGLLIRSLNYVKGNIYTKGSEINIRFAQLCHMNLIMNGYRDVDIATEDCFNELYQAEKYDYIIGDLPLNGVYNLNKFSNYYFDGGMYPSKSGKGYSAPILFVLSKLADNGIAVITVSESLLFSGGKEKEIRELLIKNDFIESIISLPNGSLKPHTDAKASILILNKNKPEYLRNKIKFIDSYITYSDSKSLDVNTEEIVKLHKNSIVEDRVDYRLIDISKLDKDINLSVSRYSTESKLVEEMLLAGRGYKLGDLLDVKSGINLAKESVSIDDGIPVIKIENLSKDILDLYLGSNSINNRIEYKAKYKRSVLNQNSILIARIGDQLKPTFFKKSIELPEIIIHSGVFALQPSNKGKSINLEYLYYQLHSEFVLNQIKQRKSGTVMPQINMASLREIVIPYMEFSAQLDFVHSQKATIISTERAKIEDRIKAFGYEEAAEQKESDIVRTLVHQLRPSLLSIDMQVNTFERIIIKHDLLNKKEFDEQADDLDFEFDELVSQPINNTLSELINSLKSDTLHLNDVLTSVNKVMNFNIDENDKVETDIYKFISDYGQKNQEQKNKEYSFEVKGVSVLVPIHITSFKEMLDQLILNAEKHGFVDFDIKVPSKIQFTIKMNKERQVAIIEYKNNGKPYQLTENDYIKPFTKSQASNGSGIGGNYVNRIVKAHKGKLSIKEDLISGFHMIIEIPLKQEKDNE